MAAASPYVELHAASAFSFLRGASLPEELVERAVELGLPAVALLDAGGVYGAPRFHKAARAAGLRPLLGAEVPLEDGSRLPVLVASRPGYQRLCRLLTRAHLRAAEKGAGYLLWSELDELAAGGLIALTGDEHGPLALALERGDRDAAGALLQRLAAAFGADHLFIELQRHLDRRQEMRNRALLELAAPLRLLPVATNGVRYARAEARAVADVFTCLAHHTRLDAAGRLLARNAERCLKSPREMARLFADRPDALARTAEIAARLDFGLEKLGYEFPQAPVPAGQTMTRWLRTLTERGAHRRYGLADAGTDRRAAAELRERARRQIDHELALIAKLKLEGYFLIVDDIMRFCRERGILAQGRGSAANSAVCYSLGITAVDPVGMELLFERFLSEERGEWPDIDIDLPSGELRERVIQYVYRRYGGAGAGGAAMTANVITYRARSAAREIGKVLDFPDEVIAKLARVVGSLGYTAESLLPDAAAGGHELRFPPQGSQVRPTVDDALRQVGLDAGHPRLLRFLQLCQAVQDLPRHLGQHSGGMVICQGALDSIVPLERASMPHRVVVQWDKDDCADLGIIKVDLLGLGMMAVLQDALALCRDRLPRAAALGEAITEPPKMVEPSGEPLITAEPSATAEQPTAVALALPMLIAEAQAVEPPPLPRVDLAWLPPEDPAVYEALCRADTIGVFQVESRAQMATLPRLRPRRFYDIVIQVALIRPGPIVGKMVHPYLRRRNGEERVTYPHPLLHPILQRTLGVPLFQEQLLRMAMAVAGFTGGQAEELRRAMGFKRSEQRMARIEQQLRQGMAERGVAESAMEAIITSISSFALYGFPESHSASFALLVYASAYLKVHFPEEFLAALLNNQPMGFYHPASLVKDAQRHGVRILPVCVNRSQWDCTVEVDGFGARGRSVRLGLRYVAGLRREAAATLLAARPAVGFASAEQLCRQVPALQRDEVRQLATVGALRALGLARRAALWQVEAAVRETGALLRQDGVAGLLPEAETEADADRPAPSAASPLPEMTPRQRMVADYRGTGVTLGPHPMAFERERLTRLGALTAAALRQRRGGQVRAAGLVITRQRPMTANGLLFISLEDETGIANVIVKRALFERQRYVCVSAASLWVEGRLQNHRGVVHLLAERLCPLADKLNQPPLPLLVASHDFH